MPDTDELNSAHSKAVNALIDCLTVSILESIDLILMGWGICLPHAPTKLQFYLKLPMETPSKILPMPLTLEK